MRLIASTRFRNNCLALSSFFPAVVHVDTGHVESGEREGLSVLILSNSILNIVSSVSLLRGADYLKGLEM